MFDREGCLDTGDPTALEVTQTGFDSSFLSIYAAISAEFNHFTVSRVSAASCSRQKISMSICSVSDRFGPSFNMEVKSPNRAGRSYFV